MAEKSKPKNWPMLNMVVQATSDEHDLMKLLQEELKGPCRSNFVFRIHSRINKVRAERERVELMERIMERSKKKRTAK